MKNRFFKSLISIVLVAMMVATLIPAMVLGAFAAETGTYVLTDLADLTATDKVIIVATHTNGTSWALTDGNGTSKAPAATVVTIEDEKITTSAENIFWNISNDNGNLTIYPAGTTDTWLYCTATNNGVRVGTNGTNQIFTVDAKSGYLKNTATSRYLGVYSTTPDWRCYTNTTGNTANQTFSFFKYEEPKHEHSYAWNNVEGTNGSHTLACANTDKKCDVLTTTEACTWVDGSCSVCGAAAPECAHPTTTTVAAVGATCTEAGYTAGVQCTVCNQYTEGHEEIAALGHEEVIDSAVAATCTATGLTEGSHCSACEEVLVAQTVVDALGHNYVNGECTGCGTVVDQYGLVTDAATLKEGDKLLLVNADKTFALGSSNSPTNDIRNKVDVLAATIGDGVINGLPEGAVVIELVAADEYWLLKVDGEKYLALLSDGNKLNTVTFGGEAPDTVKWKIEINANNEAVITSVAYNARTIRYNTSSPRFACYQSGQSAVAIYKYACNHSEDKLTTHEAVSATCTTKGNELYYTCSCGAILNANKEVIDAIPEIEEKGHTFVSGTCTECGEAQCAEHAWVDGDVITPATCTGTGLQSQHCEVCGQPNSDDKILAMLPHTPVTDAAVAATCTATGLTEGSHCEVCNGILTEQNVIPMIDHNYVDNKCDVCGDVKVTGSQLADFRFGENGEAKHDDGSAISGDTTYTSGVYSLIITNPSKVHDGAFDAKGNSAIKLGTSSVAASFSFTVPENVNTVVLYIAGYKANTAKLEINGTSYTITSKSDEGDYTKVVVDTTETKTVTLTTLSGGYRAMIDSIQFYGEEAAVTPEDTTPTISKWSISLKGDIGINVYYNVPETWAELTSGAEVVFMMGSKELSRTAVLSGENVYRCAVGVDEMGADVTCYIELNGETLTTVVTLSVNKYINAVESKSASDLGLDENVYAELKNLVGYIKTYGNAALDYKNGAEVEVVETYESAYDQIGYYSVPGINNNSESISILSTTATLDSLLSLNIYFNAASVFDGATFTLKKGSDVVGTYENIGLSAYIKDGTYGKCVVIPGILITEIGQSYTLEITDANGGTASIDVSIMGYLGAALSNNDTEPSNALKNLAAALVHLSTMIQKSAGLFA